MNPNNVTSIPEPKVSLKTRILEKKQLLIGLIVGTAATAAAATVIVKNANSEEQDYSDLTAVMDAVKENDTDLPE